MNRPEAEPWLVRKWLFFEESTILLGSISADSVIGVIMLEPHALKLFRRHFQALLKISVRQNQLVDVLF